MPLYTAVNCDVIRLVYIEYHFSSNIMYNAYCLNSNNNFQCKYLTNNYLTDNWILLKDWLCIYSMNVYKYSIHYSPQSQTNQPQNTF